jgi:hypothetical protein
LRECTNWWWRAPTKETSGQGKRGRHVAKGCWIKTRVVIACCGCYMLHSACFCYVDVENHEPWYVHRLIFDTKWHSRILLLTTLLTDSILHIRLGEVRSNNSLVTSF